MTGGAAAAARPTVEPRRVQTVVVRGGDSLWSIAADLLSSQAGGRVTDRDITVAWHRLHAANAGRVGPDPDLILPGTRLAVPAPSEQFPSDREEHP
jgi:nucleoid-associated protein YgaU